MHYPQTFKELKVQLNANSVAEFKQILEAANRSVSEPIASEDYEFLVYAYPQVRQGKSIEEILASLQNSEESTEFSNRQMILIENVEQALRKDSKLFYQLYFQNWGNALNSPEILNDPDVKAARSAAVQASAVIVSREGDRGEQSFFTSFNKGLQQKGFLLPPQQPKLLIEAAPVIEHEESGNFSV